MGLLGGGLSHLPGILLGLALVQALSLLPEVVLGEVGGVMPGVVCGGRINVAQLLFRGANTRGSVCGGVAGDVAEENRGILEELPELSVGNEESSKGPQALKSLVALLVCRILVNGSAGHVDGFGIPLLGLPDEVLQEVALVLGEKEVLRILDDLTGVGDELLALGRQVLRGVGDALGGEEAVQGDIDLIILFGSSVSRHDYRHWRLAVAGAHWKWRRTEGTLPSWKAEAIP